jgi:hypothetical protein
MELDDSLADRPQRLVGLSKVFDSDLRWLSLSSTGFKLRNGTGRQPPQWAAVPKLQIPATFFLHYWRMILTDRLTPFSDIFVEKSTQDLRNFGFDPQESGHY